MVYLARGFDLTGSWVNIDRSASETLGGPGGWIPLAEAKQHMDNGSIVDAGSVSGLLAVLLLKAEGKL